MRTEHKEIKEPFTILIAEDDSDDRLILQRALMRCQPAPQLHFVHDGEELMEYLHQSGRYSEPVPSPRPGIILLDLNMPRKDGREALREIKSDTVLRQIPVIIFTTSKADEDIYRSYDLGVNSFVTKPSSFEEMVQLVQSVVRYWFEIVELPTDLPED